MSIANKCVALKIFTLNCTFLHTFYLLEKTKICVNWKIVNFCSKGSNVFSNKSKQKELKIPRLKLVAFRAATGVSTGVCKARDACQGYQGLLCVKKGRDFRPYNILFKLHNCWVHITVISQRKDLKI